jgi:hypothetical protein
MASKPVTNKRGDTFPSKTAAYRAYWDEVGPQPNAEKFVEDWGIPTSHGPFGARYFEWRRDRGHGPDLRVVPAREQPAQARAVRKTPKNAQENTYDAECNQLLHGVIKAFMKKHGLSEIKAFQKSNRTWILEAVKLTKTKKRVSKKLGSACNRRRKPCTKTHAATEAHAQ